MLAGRERPSLGRELPRFVLEQRLRGERGADVFVGKGHDGKEDD